MSSDDIPDPFFLDDDDTLDDPLSARHTPAIPSPRPAPPPKLRVVRGLRNPSLFLPIPSVRYLLHSFVRVRAHVAVRRNWRLKKVSFPRFLSRQIP